MDRWRKDIVIDLGPSKDAPSDREPLPCDSVVAQVSQADDEAEGDAGVL